jgi:hypothetical protein
MSVSNLYIPRIGLHISCSRIGRSIMGLNKSLTGTWMWKLGLWPRNSFSWNIDSEFSVLGLCSGVSMLWFSVWYSVLNDSKTLRSSLFTLAPCLPHLIPLILWCDLLSFQSQRIRRKIVVLSGDISGHYMFHRLKFYTRETPSSLPPPRR